MNLPMSHLQALDVAAGDARRCSKALALDVRRAIRGLGLDDDALRALLDVDPWTARAIRTGDEHHPPDSALAHRLLLLVRLHRGLGDVYGSTDRMDRWLDSEEPALQGRPRDLMRSLDGLRRVVANVEGRCKDCLW